MVRGVGFFLAIAFFIPFQTFAQTDDDQEIQKKIAAVEAKRKKYYERERKLFTSATAYEAEVKFQHFVELTSDGKPTKTTALDQIDKQLFHLFGPLGEDAEGFVAAVPRGDYEIDRDKVVIEQKKGTTKQWVVSYQYRGTLLVENEKGVSLAIVLPRNPDKIYAQSAVKKGAKTKYPCTDDHYDSKDDFWYFWNPDKEGCQLEEGVHYDVITDYKLKKTANEKHTYPNYPGLVDDDGVLRISVLIGLDEPKMTAANRNPKTSKDINAATYKLLRKSLVAMGYEAPKQPWTLEEIQSIAPIKEEEMVYVPYVETLRREATRTVMVDGKRKPLQIEVRLYFGPSGITESEEGNAPFHYFYKDALEKSAAMIYDGHSGLGGHLDLDAIEQEHDFSIEMPKKKHQIFFFNSCSSYTYYNLSYIERKGGTQYLDIMVNGLATAFDVMHNTNLKLIESIDLWADKRTPKTYQAMAKVVDSSNLFAVNGDDKGNPTTVEELN